MRRADEINRLYSDIFRMTREVLLERELLARKTDQLLFLNRSSRVPPNPWIPAPFSNRAKEDMNLLFPVSALQAVFWNPAATDSIEAELLVSPNTDNASRQEWMDHLLENAVRLAAAPVKNFRLDILPKNGVDAPLQGPQSGETVVMPLRTGYEYFGCLALCSPKGTRLAKDQVQTMRAAINHLALALKNAMLYTQAKTRAEYDGLTKIHNRASFDERLMEEIKRHQRHGHDFSLLLLDLDHFKRINDDYGHQAGDLVLRGIARYWRKPCVSPTSPPATGGRNSWCSCPRLPKKRPGFWRNASAKGSPKSRSTTWDRISRSPPASEWPAFPRIASARRTRSSATRTRPCTGPSRAAATWSASQEKCESQASVQQ